MTIRIYDEDYELFEWQQHFEVFTETTYINCILYCFVNEKLFHFLKRNSDELDVYTTYEMYNNIDIVDNINNLVNNMIEIRGSLFNSTSRPYSRLFLYNNNNIKFFPESIKNKIIENEKLTCFNHLRFDFSTNSKKVYSDYKLCIQ